MRNMFEGVKICGVMNEDDINGAAEAGARAVGVLIRPDSTYEERSQDSHSVNMETAAKLARATPFSMRFVAVAHTEDLDKIVEIIETIGPDRLQLGETENPELAAELRSRYKAGPYPQIVQSIRVREDTEPDVIDAFPDIRFFLLDSPGDLPGGNGVTHDWDTSREIVERAYAHGKFVILAGGLDPDLVSEAVTHVRPVGLDVESGVRTNGMLDRQLMKLFVQRAEEAAAA